MWEINHLCPPGVLTKCSDALSLSVRRTWDSLLAFMCLSLLSSSNYACTVSWVCKWTSGWCIYLWHVTACTYFLSSLKERSGSLEFNTFALRHFPSAIRGISNDSAWILHAAVQLCDTFKWRELAVTEPWLSSWKLPRPSSYYCFLLCWIFAHCQVSVRERVITAARNAKAHYSRG